MKSVLDTNGIAYEIYHSPETKFRIYVHDPDGTQIELVDYQDNYALK